MVVSVRFHRDGRQDSLVKFTIFFKYTYNFYSKFPYNVKLSTYN